MIQSQKTNVFPIQELHTGAPQTPYAGLLTMHHQSKEPMAMLVKTMTSLIFSTACLTGIATLTGAPAQAASPHRHSSYAVTAWSPQQNIRASEHYDRLVATDPAFRRMRMRIECSPITDLVLHQQCIQSFQQQVQAWHDGQLQAFYRLAHRS